MSSCKWATALVLILYCHKVKLIRGDSSNGISTCISSSRKPYQVNTTEDSFRNTLLEGRCFLRCLETGVYQEMYTNHSDSIRPYPIINETADCLPDLVKLHSCVEGCVSFNGYGECPCLLRSYCGECNGCIIPETKKDIWMSQAGCSVNCYIEQDCQRGCNNKQRLLGSDSITQDYLSSKPVFRNLNNSYKNGLYLVSLASTSLTPSSSLTGFLFQITDQQSGNISYIWQNDWTKPLDLSGYGCRTVNVSLTLIDERRDTIFKPVEIHVEGDKRNEILNNFACSKDIEIYTETSTPEAYFNFNLQWETMMYSDSIEKFAIDYAILDLSTKETIATYEPTRYLLSNSFSTNYTNFNLSRRNATEEVFVFELRIHWKNGEIQETPYTCTLSGQSPAPEAVQYFEITKAHVIDNGEVQVSAKWSPPLEVNGILAGYRLCLSKKILEGNEIPQQTNSICLNVSSENNSLDTKMGLNISSDEHHGYIQIQSFNTYVPGPWSDSVTVVLVKKSQYPLIVAAYISTCLIIVSFVVALTTFYVLCRLQVRRKQMQIEVEPMPMNCMKVEQIIASLPEMHFELEDKWEVSPRDIRVDEEVGHGQFGKVMSGTLLRSSIGSMAMNSIPVAMKLLKTENVAPSIKKRFLSEIEIMKKVSQGHNPHVVAMLGCVTMQEPLCLVTELVEFGDLLSYLQNVISPSESKLTEDEILNFSYQIADGMEYISNLGIVHRDLACRNILVDKDKVLKIADFGLSQECSSPNTCTEVGVPLKWMPLEYLEGSVFTSASDVWSFGIVLWEITTLGKTPYKEIRNKDLLFHLKEGHRLEKPVNASITVYEVMQSCWRENPTDRPTFNVLKQTFNDKLEYNKQYLILDKISNERTPQTIADTNVTTTKHTLSCDEWSNYLPRSVSLNMEYKNPPVLERLTDEAVLQSEYRYNIKLSKSIGVIHEVAQCENLKNSNKNDRFQHGSIKCDEPRYC